MHCRLLRVRPDLHRLRGRVPGRGDGRELRRCITTNLDCADVCAATGRVLTRRTETDPALVRSLVEACRAACAACADECEKHAGMHEHCRVCAEACRRCEAACAALLSDLA